MKHILLLILAVISFQTYAQSKYVCTKAHAERDVEVIYHAPGSQTLCEVKYTKQHQSDILWSAQHKVGYCETKAQKFTEKLASFGWSCYAVNDELKS
ncbi:hypothetical protein C0W96_00245 [Photobacterium kishitanii]|uniref:DUF1496 domain-containing protein n=1 Tax=Photobacterium kishitanii TaxID=318456 RepID=A0AAX0YVP4_9GAMM|nr:hypothetical protein [Photobacterium kishitanii]PSV07720.1 hypothetical protein C0W96_00245 [Photobacterium kishitanii]PSV76208.1 hypothetical protein C0W29_07485 [Photobacterium kishitanii]PSX19847.1 hypothetical protein C0W70_07795 [Photobacterium kishitanii]PSX29633.1 hypothetical protein C0W52_06430 [Photobacterium kishitanii]PSX34142.1 hypothetical protein C0W39_07535 [Photobacterium kishitanii]